MRDVGVALLGHICYTFHRQHPGGPAGSLGSRRKPPTNGAAWGRMGPHGVDMGHGAAWRDGGVGVMGPHGVGMGPHGVGMGPHDTWGWGLAWAA
jgi:hypothetical protein